MPNATDDRQHIYRVEKDGTNTISLYVDGDRKLAFAYSDLASSSLNQSSLATTSGPGESAFYLKYYRHRIGSTEFQTSGVGCDADFDEDDDVDTDDLLALFANWGACPAAPTTCIWDLNDDDVVSTEDLLILFASWGPCP